MNGGSAEDHIREGEAHFGAGRVVEAEKSFETALESGRHPVALNNLGVLHFGKGDVARAKVLFTEALMLRPDYGEARENLEDLVRSDLVSDAAGKDKAEADAFAARDEKNAHPPMTGKKIGLLPGITATPFHEVSRLLSACNQVRPLKSLSRDDIAALAEWADLILALEGTSPLIDLSRLSPGRKLVIHFQRDEIVSDGFMEGMDWGKVAGITFAAPHLMDLAGEYWGKRLEGIPLRVIQNGVSIEDTPLGCRGPGHDIGIVGNINQGLGVDVLLQCVHQAASLDPEYRFHILGSREDQRFVTYLEHLLEAMGLRASLVIHDPSEGTSAFLGRMNFLLSPSPFEGLPPSLLEAMARGIKPIIHDWPGASELFPEELVFRTVPEFKAHLGETAYDSGKYRAWVADRYPLSRHLDGLEDFLRGLVAGKEG